MTEYHKFEKDPDGRWYVILPHWDGDRAELEMVMGADTMLDILAQGENNVEVMLSLKEYSDHKFKLSFKEEFDGGGLYELTSEHHNFDVWLCHVVKFVFGYIPENIYIG